MLKSITLICLIAIGFLLSPCITVQAKTPDGKTPAVEGECDGLTGASFGLCNAYCEAMDCDSDNPKASEKACNKVLANFENKTGQIPPCLDSCLACREFEYCVEGQCVDPCADLVDGDPENECPCNFFDVPMTEDCWILNQDDQLIFSPLGMDSDSCRILTGTQQNGLIRMEARQFAGEYSCVVNGFSSDICMGPESAFVNGISEAQFLTCLCRIERYADGLEGDSSIDFINGDPPFYCVPCGNGMLEQAEQCDDGNTVPGDGCSADCSFVEPGYQCPTPGELCTAVCGDGILTAQEQCDDGNTTEGDGCSADCSTIDPGFQCPNPGSPCTGVCGDGILTFDEQCDDGNTAAGDGCSADCSFVELGFQCPNPGSPCTGVCGDGILTFDEQCDDGNTDAGDGCSADCSTVEPGFQCPTPGSPCSEDDT